ncbi:hypothetical protein JTB14_000355 [Gonioctena quinquepunctata]|nr:hypothetical protein JTB14_000355 [Gonioctena quinquepunctata]
MDIKEIKIDKGEISTNPKEIADKFVEHFTAIGKNLSKKIYKKELKDNFRIQSTMFLEEISEIERYWYKSDGGDKEHDDFKYQNNNEEEAKTQFINYGGDDQMEIQGYVSCDMKTKTVWIFYLLTLGTLRLFFHWYPHLKLKSTHRRCSLKNAEKVLVIDTYRKFRSYFVKDVKTLRGDTFGIHSDDEKQLNDKNVMEFNLCDGRHKQLYRARIIKCKKLVYIWDDEKNTFFKLAGFDKGISRNELHSFKGQSEDKQVLKRVIYGHNEISVPVQTVSTLILLEALTPFYIFQLFSLVVWLSEQYYYYTFAIITMTVVGISTSVLQTRKNQKNLRGKVNFVDTALVCRGDGTYDEIPTTELVPGDLIVIPSVGCEMQCDAVLLTGNCVVNESMLTGESVPITKTQLPENCEQYNLKEDVNHTLFCGTKIIQTRSKGNEKVLAVVIRTGYLTAKGELVRSILYPPPADFKFETDSYKFIGILALIALFGVVYTFVLKWTRKINTLDILIKSLDLVTIAVPPALPAAMTVGKLYALNRLKNKLIFCINSRVINVSGSIDCVCFDKTGTLTEDELDMWGIVPVENKKFNIPLNQVKLLPYNSSLLRGMATCQSLTKINSELGGDPLDIKMFESTGWDIEESNGRNSDDHIVVKPKEGHFPENQLQIDIIKHYQFSSHLQRMSVIVKSSDSDDFDIFCKGSPEMIISLSTSSSVPEDFLTVSRNIPVRDTEKMHRGTVECDLDFLGLVVLENKLKAQTTDIMKILKDASLKVAMITGDNIQTGIHVAKECGMVETDQAIIEISANGVLGTCLPSISYQVIRSALIREKRNEKRIDIEKIQQRSYCFAITGQSWANVIEYFPDMIPKIVTKGIVFARMSGMQKQQLVEEFKNLGYYVAMCGDGANDCGALKAAHVGISLSEAESSVASPFTSREQNISCVPKVIKEGRAALVTSFGVFKVMLCYSLMEFASVMILYNVDANLASMQFLFIDIALILNFASVFGNTKAYDCLDKVPPKTSLVGFIPVSSMVLFVVMGTFFQLLGYYWIQTYDWFEPFVYNKEDSLNLLSHENYAIFSISLFQYIIMCVVFSKGKPYRKPLYTNVYFTASLVITTSFCIYMVLSPAEWLRNVIELKLPPIEGRYAMLGIALANFIVCTVLEDLIVEYFLGKVVASRLGMMEKSKRKYLAVLKDLNEETSWLQSSDEEAVILNNSRRREESGAINKGFVESQSDVTRI